MDIPTLRSSRDLYEYRFNLQEHLKNIDTLISSTDMGDYPMDVMRKLMIVHQDYSFKQKLRYRMNLLSMREDAIDTLSVVNRLIDKLPIMSESAFSGVMTENSIVDESKEQNFLDAVGDSIKFVSAGNSENSDQGQLNVLSMSDYLSRPVEIYEADISTPQYLALNVWDLFTLQPSVRAKIRNYAYLRGNLHVRISISGTPFHFGRMLVSYQPFAVYNPTLTNYATMVSTSSSVRPLLFNYLSQAPGAAVINVNENLPLEITCPFISTKPMHRLFNYATTAIAAGTSFDDMADAGTLYVYTLNAIGSVSTSPADVTMQVYAWMTDVELGTNTATILTITTESQFDEREQGVVQRIASRGAQIAEALTRVPMIARFARASAIVLSAVRDTAALFGWSKPVIIQETKLVKNLPFTNGACTIGDDTNFRVVLDPKQELTVDPRVIGSDQDDMTIKSISSRSSFLQTFVWSYSDSIMANPIFIGRVNPSMVTWVAGTKNTIQPTAMAFAAAPFSHWRGDITFRFEIVCSQYHRGKIAIFYEPNASQMTLIDANLSFNKQYIRIIDIQQTQVFEVTIKWAAYRSWLRVNNAGAAVLNTSLSYTGTENQGFCNGYIGVVPFTQLTSPSSSPAIPVNVYVRCDNLQLNGLSTLNMPTERILFTGSIMAESSFSSRSDSESVSSQQGSISTSVVSVLDLNDSTASVQHICEEHFGEQPISFRALLKRYVTHAAYAAGTGSGINTLRLIANVYPNNNLQYAMTSVTYNDLYSYLRYAYVGMRGGVRFRIRNVGSTGVTEHMQVKCTLAVPSNGTVESIAYLGGSVGAVARLAGSASFVANTNGGYEVEFPFYSNNLWVFSFVDGLTGGTATDNMSDVWFRQFYFDTEYSSTTIAATSTMTEFATAEDFSFLRFQGAPFYSASPVS